MSSRYLTTVLLLWILVTPLNSWAAPPMPPQTQWTTMTLSPYGFINQHGEIDGLLHAINQHIAQRGGLPSRFDLQPNTRLVEHLLRDLTDCSTFIRSGWSEEKTIPVADTGLKMHTIILARKGTPINSYADVQKLRVAVLRGSRFGHLIDNDPDMNRIESDDYAQSARMLAAGRVDALVGTDISLATELPASGLTPEQLEEPLTLSRRPVWVHCRMSMDGDPRIPIIEKQASLLRKSGIFQKLMIKYVNEPLFSWLHRPE
ncbi:substrate-binding periplasmic protein [Magnetococcus sp. PR-3]|uniref:substrate-binding periplasmic protein n=1 Tax=Magnetococcus sp. PR-3 TaxID=3120355 RepID=UPI002FCDF18C